MSDLINEVGSAGSDVGGGNPFDDFTIVDDDGKPVDDNPKKGIADDKNTVDNKAGNQDGQQKPPQVTGFESRFFKPDEKGETAFDADGALSFLMPKQDSKLAFNYQRAAAPSQEPDKATVPKEPEKPENPYLKRVREEREYQESLRKQHYVWPEKFQEAINQGYNAEQAAAYANKSVQDLFDTSFSEWKTKRDEEEAENRYKNETSSETLRKTRITAESNIAAISSELGGQDQFQMFMIGHQGPDGKWQKGLATDAINLIFDLQNPDIKNPTQDQMNDWWYKFSSNMANLQFLVDYGLSKLTRSNLDKMIAHGKKVDAETARQQRMGQSRTPSGIKGGAPSMDGMEDITGFMTPRGMATI
jgi:hypothetical protein